MILHINDLSLNFSGIFLERNAKLVYKNLKFLNLLELCKVFMKLLNRCKSFLVLIIWKNTSLATKEEMWESNVGKYVVCFPWSKFKLFKFAIMSVRNARFHKQSSFFRSEHSLRNFIRVYRRVQNILSSVSSGKKLWNCLRYNIHARILFLFLCVLYNEYFSTQKIFEKNHSSFYLSSHCQCHS